MVDILKDIMKEISDVMDKVGEEELNEFVSYLQKDNKIFVDGEGRSGLMAKGFAMRLMHLGFRVYVIGETITPSMEKEDIFIAVSGSGESSNTVSDTKKAIKAGSNVLAVTSNAQSSIASIANMVLIVPGTVKSQLGKERKSIQLLSSLFDQTLHITLDAICLMLSRREQFSNAEATKKHW